MKGLIIISTGRCGTKRISQILAEALKEKGIAVTHQRPLSRFCNVMGHLMMMTIDWQWLKRTLFNFQVKTGSNGFVFADPLTATCIPKNVTEFKHLYILHIHRSDQGYAKSMYRLTRKRVASWLAHNLIPFWQPGIWPFENALNRLVQLKYERVNTLKNDYFKEQFSNSPNYRTMNRRDCFKDGNLSKIVQEAFGIKIHIEESELKIRSNQS